MYSEPGYAPASVSFLCSSIRILKSPVCSPRFSEAELRNVSEESEVVFYNSLFKNKQTNKQVTHCGYIKLPDSGAVLHSASHSGRYRTRKMRFGFNTGPSVSQTRLRFSLRNSYANSVVTSLLNPPDSSRGHRRINSWLHVVDTLDSVLFV